MITPFEFKSEILNSTRTLWLQTVEDSPSNVVCLFLDAEIYVGPVGAPRIVAELISSGQIPDVSAAFLSFGTPEDRHVDFTCNDRFTSVLVEEIVPWIETHLSRSNHILLCGLSLSGLAAIYALQRHPNCFKGVLSQSPSAWWNDEWLAGHLSLEPERSAIPKIWLSVGHAETQKDVIHGPGLHQKTSQLESCERLVAALNQKGDQVHFEVFNGGHDGPSWAADLRKALPWLLTSAATPSTSTTA